MLINVNVFLLSIPNRFFGYGILLQAMVAHQMPDHAIAFVVALLCIVFDLVITGTFYTALQTRIPMQQVIPNAMAEPRMLVFHEAMLYLHNLTIAFPHSFTP